MPFPDPTKHFLVYADDDEDDLQFVRESLLPYAHTLDVFTFNAAQSAHHFLQRMEAAGIRPCLVILDMNMPGMSGKDLLVLLRGSAFFKETPIILFTTSNAQHDYAFALKYNAGFITKPLHYTQMTLIAEEFLSHCTKEVRERIREGKKD